MNIRDAARADRHTILGITLQAYGQYAEALPEHFWRLYRRNIEQTLEDIGPAQQIVAEVGGEILGTVLLYPPGSAFAEAAGAATSDACPEVRLLAVAPAARGRGIGQALMDECIRRVRRSGAPGVVLHTMAMMAAARHIYTRMGFVRAPELDFRPLEGWEVEGYRLATANLS